MTKFYCAICDKDIPMNSKASHLEGNPHAKEIMKLLNAIGDIQSTEGNRNGVEIGKVPTITLKTGDPVYVYFNIWNNEQPVVLQKVLAIPNREGFTLSDNQNTTYGASIVLAKGDSYRIRLDCRPPDMGSYPMLLIFEFEGFRICRHFVANIEDDIISSLKATAPYIPKKFTRDENPRKILEGSPPSHGENIEKVRKFEKFWIPKGLKVDDMAKGELSVENYQKFFHSALYKEEVQMNEDIKRYDMENVKLFKSGQFLQLKVPGLAEKRPSVLVGDMVIVWLHGETNMEYRGFAHAVRLEEVSLKFHNTFHQKYIGQYCSVKFTVNRLPLRRMHQAISESQSLMPLLFPLQTESSPTFKYKIKTPYNRSLNKEQIQSVESILSHTSQSPYIIFGPPGTGKTNTVVEAILQTYSLHPKSKILACAPSNSASDLLVERLSRVVTSTREIVRINAPSRDVSSIPNNISTYCKSGGMENAEIAKYRIVVVTCVSAGLLYLVGSQFTHVFIDECGHACEPEALISLAGLIKETTQVVLAGDPKQLGPVIRSPYAKQLGLHVSLLARLCTFTKYSRNNSNSNNNNNTSSLSYNSNCITKLVQNYRSHSDILRLPSKLFYDNELVPCASPSLINSLLKWDKLPNKEFPLIFHGIQGKDEREGNSPSWFNAAEAKRVFDYVDSLISDKSLQLRPSDIGVISPYRKQVEKIRELVRKKIPNSEQLTVGSVEEFQGSERRVIVISTVRSSSQYLEFDYAHNLGFLKNPERFNVAITRAQALLIVVGNPNVLMADVHWKELLMYCKAKKAFIGVQPTFFDNKDDDKNNNNNSGNSGGSISQIELQEGAEWRNDY